MKTGAAHAAFHAADHAAAASAGDGLLCSSARRGRHRQQVGPCQAMMVTKLFGQPSGIFALAGCIAAKHAKDRSQSLSIGRREISHAT